MLYSIIPPEVVLRPADGPAAVLWEEVEASGARRLILRRDADGRVVIERIISTEPRDYLDPALQPGQPYHPGRRE